ncbi:hypothetical protein BPODLACK_00631 [Gordonia sp. YY1]|nr:hypothetical protein BPODLACK_00631 [Gordonia sp. YY1]
MIGSIASAGFALLAKLKVLSDSISATIKVGAGGTLFSAGLSMSLIGIGHLVGVTVGVAMLVGLLISYGVLLPIESQNQGEAGESLSDIVSGVFANDVRLIGAGAIAIAAIWTLIKVMGPTRGGSRGHSRRRVHVARA